MSASAFFAPLIVFAGNGGGDGQLGGIEDWFVGLNDIVNLLVGITFTLIVVAFFFGLAKFVMNADDQEARDQGKHIMIGGVIALFIAASIWGIIAFLGDQFGIDTDDSSGTTPTVDFEADN